jgi:hypothetical protein
MKELQTANKALQSTPKSGASHTLLGKLILIDSNVNHITGNAYFTVYTIPNYNLIKLTN